MSLLNSNSNRVVPRFQSKYTIPYLLGYLCPPRCCCPPSLPPTSANLDVRHSAYSVEGEWNSKMPLAIFVLLTIGTLTLLILILLKFFMKQTDGALKQDCGGLTLTLEKRCHFPRRDWELFFFLSSGETKSWLSYDHSRISTRERDYILLFSCFKMRSRL